MPAISFSPQFVQDVITGKKRQTIRSMRKRPFKKGDLLYLYTGMRTSHCEKLGEAVATEVVEIVISDRKRVHLLEHPLSDWRELSFTETCDLARADGFDGVVEFFDFFELAGLPFSGQLIKWEEVSHE